MADRRRRDELASRLEAVQARIARAAAASGTAQVTLVVVTKTWPTTDIRLLHNLGVVDVGENRHQEAEPKATELADLGLVWHFVGQVQSNKAAAIARYADLVHSVDSVRVARRLDAGAHRHGRTVSCLVQVSLDPPGGRRHRGGVVPGDVAEVADAIESADALRLAGVMGIAPLGGDPAAAFSTLADVAADLRRDHPQATAVSAGMSEDFEQAIAAGATHVRVGSAILGSRPPLG